MSSLARRIENLQDSIYAVYLKEQQARSQGATLEALAYSIRRWSLMLYREYVRDDVKIRAESLAYLMTVSLLPIVAGLFFIFNILAQFGLVQEAIGGFVNELLSTIPEEHRLTVTEYTLRFKDAYLIAMSGKSGKIGLFALLILFWVGLQTFNNIDRALNHIWASRRDRPFFEKVRNFILVAVCAPCVITLSLSVPLILRQIPTTRLLLEAVPLLPSLLNFLIPVLLILGTFTWLYRFVPVSPVRWKSALIGGFFAAALLQLSNWGMNIYFRFGTNSAYGKAAIIPLLAFWIYLIWLIIILGAEVSYIYQNEKFIVSQRSHTPSFFEAKSLLVVLKQLLEAHEEGRSPLSLEQLHLATNLSLHALCRILDFLEDRGWLLRSLPTERMEEAGYALARNIHQERAGDILRQYILEKLPETRDRGVEEQFHQSLEIWLSSYENLTLEELSF